MTNPQDPNEELKSIDEQLEALEARRREIYRISLEAPDCWKLCEDFVAEMLSKPERKLEFPILVKGLSFSGEMVQDRRKKAGQLVAVRPCDEEYAGKTFLGIYMGDVALSYWASFAPQTGVMQFSLGMNNPAMWVPELGRIIYGCGSWWSPIKNEQQLREITNDDIDSIWYVQALRSLTKAPPAKLADGD